MPLVQTRGAASAQGFGEFAQVTAVNYIEDVFSCFLYTGNGSTQTITNGIDLSTKGGLVWIKDRDSGAKGHALFDTARGVNLKLQSQSANGQFSGANQLTAFNTTGFNLGSAGDPNGSGTTYASWTFREQAKFFDVVTYTGDGIAGRTVAHNLGSEPGFFVIKRLDASGDWRAYHRSLGANKFIYFNATLAALTSSDIWNNTAPTSTVFTLGNANSQNIDGATYVAYLFAHDAGGFGLTDTDNVISCGSYTEGASATTVTLGYEPQWLLVKKSSATSSWYLIDNMRGLSYTDTVYLEPNTSTVENFLGSSYFKPTATGFIAETAFFGSGSTIIYIAIRRGPMKVPTTGTSVFTPLALNNASGTVNTTGFPIDFQMQFYRSGGIGASNSQWVDRLRGFSSTSTQTGPRLYTPSTDAENNTALGTLFNNTGFSTSANWANIPMAYWSFRRAPSFFDEVCYMGNGSNRNITHSLGVAPQMMITKNRSTTGPWVVYTATTGNTNYLQLYTDDAVQTNTDYYNSTTPTASVFTLGVSTSTNQNAQNFVAYLFATCAGVSKVGSYTGTAATQTIDCGFGAGGSRFVVIKRTNSTGDWYVWDSARGMISGTDPSLLFNSFNAEVNANSVYAISTGFQIVSTAAGINASGGSYIFLSVA